jgi:hypothetical protein
MKQGVIFPETWDKNCKAAHTFGSDRGRTAALGIKQVRFPLRLLRWPERMAYLRGYESTYKRVRLHMKHPRHDDEYRRQQHGT